MQELWEFCSILSPYSTKVNVLLSYTANSSHWWYLRITVILNSVSVDSLNSSVCTGACIGCNCFSGQEWNLCKVYHSIQYLKFWHIVLDAVNNDFKLQLFIMVSNAEPENWLSFLPLRFESFYIIQIFQLCSEL